MSGDGVKRVIGPLSPPPSAYTDEVQFTHPGGGAELRCVYERNGSLVSGGLRFSGVRAYRFRAEPYCTAWHIEQAYDTLVEVEGSDWVRELLSAEPSEIERRGTIRHFLVYVDGSGAYEVAAGSCEWIPEAAAS